MKIKYKLEMTILLLMVVGISTVSAFPAEENACNTVGCHAYPPTTINITTDVTSTLTVSPGETFNVTVDWSGGNPGGTTTVKYPNNTGDNLQFNPVPHPISSGNIPSGTQLSTLTAPAPGDYIVRVFASRGSNNTVPRETDFKNITVQVTTQAPAQTFNISGFKINSSDDTGVPGWTITLTNDTLSVPATTDANGMYQFTGLANGTYTVTETLEPDWTNVTPTSIIVTVDGADVPDQNFTNTPFVTPPTNVTVAIRTIENESLRLGESTIITVDISSDRSQALSLHEIIPAGWNLTRVSDDADAFKSSTNEWIWFNVTPGINKTVIYRLTAPGDAPIGTYRINGTISSSSGVIAVVQGDDTITLDIIAFYRRLGINPDKVETTDVLTAVEDWRNNIAPDEFERSITTQELLALIDEWLTNGE